MHEEDGSAARELLAQVACEATINVSSELRIQHADGTWRDFEVIAKNLVDDAGVGGIVVTFHDITERKAFERDLQQLAFHDTLSGLPNRALFLDRLERALARADRYRRSIAVMFLDLDNFKVVNDSLGHEVGDQLLVRGRRRLRECLRDEDTAARLGGDELAVLLEDIVDEQGVIEIAERISSTMTEPLVLNGRELFVTFSIGIALSTPGHDRPDTLLRERRPGDVPGQGERQGPLPGVRSEHDDQRAGAAGAGDRPAPRPRSRRAPGGRTSRSCRWRPAGSASSRRWCAGSIRRAA